MLLSALLFAGFSTQAQDSAATTCTVNVQDAIRYANLLGDANLKFFVPAVADSMEGYIYEWTFTWHNLSQSVSQQKEPVIPALCSNPLKQVKVKIYASPSCFKEISVLYPENGIRGTKGQLRIAPPPYTATDLAPLPVKSN